VSRINHSFEKRKRELDKKRKQDEKRLKKNERKKDEHSGTQDLPPPAVAE
jgi:hypothetical protein